MEQKTINNIFTELKEIKLEIKELSTAHRNCVVTVEGYRSSTNQKLNEILDKIKN